MITSCWITKQYMSMQQKNSKIQNRMPHIFLLSVCVPLLFISYAHAGTAPRGMGNEVAWTEIQQPPRRNNHGNRIDPEELRKKQEAYITKEAGLTSGEAAFFFPLFRELKQKQRAIRKSIRSNYLRVWKEKLSEKECDKTLLKIEQLEKQDTGMEIAYYAKWRKKLSSSKIIRILEADRRFSKQVFNRHVQ